MPAVEVHVPLDAVKSWEHEEFSLTKLCELVATHLSCRNDTGSQVDLDPLKDVQAVLLKHNPRNIRPHGYVLIVIEAHPFGDRLRNIQERLEAIKKEFDILGTSVSIRFREVPETHWV